jgi:hypothetical protein
MQTTLARVRHVSPAAVRNRWISAEAIRLLRMGFSYRQIAGLFMDLAAGRLNPEAAFGAIPTDVTFPPDYRISDTRIWQLVKHALDRSPALEAKHLRRVWGARLEETWAFLYPKMRRGDARAIEVGMKVAERAAKLWGLDAPAKLAVKSDENTTLTIVQVRDLLLADVVEVEAKGKSAALAIEERGELIEASEEAERAEEREKQDPEVRAGLPEETEVEEESVADPRPRP